MQSLVLCLFVFLCFSISLYALEWGPVISSTQDCEITIRGFDYDSDESLIIVGSFNGTLSLGTQSITSSTSNQSFISKRNYEGEWEWIATAISTTGMNMIVDLKVDNDGNTVVLGAFGNSLTLGSTTFTSSRLTVFLAKLDPEGNWLWGKTIGNNFNCMPGDLWIDQYNDIYLVSHFMGTLELGDYEVQSSPVNFNSFVGKLNPAGFWLWAVAPEAPTNYTSACVLHVSEQGECTVCFKLNGSAVFGDTNISGTDVLVLCSITRYGMLQWTCPLTQSCSISLKSITRDRFGGIYILADFYIPTAIGGIAIEPWGNNDMILFKTDDSGTIAWMRQIGGGSSQMTAVQVVSDNSGRIFCSAEYSRGEVGTYPTANGIPLPDYGDTASDFTNLVLTKFNPAGDWQGVLTAGGSSYDYTRCVRLDCDGNVGVLGYSYSPTLSFGPEVITNPDQEVIFCATAIDEDFAPCSSPVIHTIQTDGYDLTLMWTEVFENENGDPYIPDAYIVLYSEHADDNPEDFYYLGMTTGDLLYTHYGVARFRKQMFYSVIAYTDTRASILPMLRRDEEKFRTMKWRELSKLIE